MIETRGCLHPRLTEASEMAKLICVGGMNRGDEFPLMPGASLIGRGKECQIVLFDKRASRSHCRIVREGNYLALEDLGSRNGTFLNGKQITKKSILKVGDRIGVGSTLLEFSDKGLGGILEQTVTDVAADIQEKRYDKLMSSATADVTNKNRHSPGTDTVTINRNGLKGLFRKIFGS